MLTLKGGERKRSGTWTIGPARTLAHEVWYPGGRSLREIGQDVSEVLDYEPGTFHVVRHVRPRLACANCITIMQAPAPSRPVDRCMAGTGLLAQVLVSKYCDHTPLYRLCQIYGREGVQLQRSTLADWVAQAARLLSPLADAIGRYVLAADKIHGDDTPIRVLGGAGAKARTGRLWAYVRDDRPSGDAAPPAVWFQYSANRRGEHPTRHLRPFKGILQGDAFAGYHPLYEDGRVVGVNTAASSKSALTQQQVQLAQCLQGRSWWPQFHRGTGRGVEHPRCDNDDDPGRSLDVHYFTVGPLLAVLPSHPAPVQRMPAVEHLDFLPDMGRMTS